jgi:hypothetical protein
MTMTTTQTAKKFEPGKSYTCRSSCDYDSIFAITVLSRTDSTITVSGDVKQGSTGRLRIRVIRGVETVKPMGTYSMAPMMWADKNLAVEAR